jgi:hypothetical protein
MKNIDDAYVSGKTEIILDSNGKKIKFYANEIGFLEQQNILRQTGINHLAAFVAASVTDEAGNRFTYDEVLRMKREYAEPLLTAVAELLGDASEKN